MFTLIKFDEIIFLYFATINRCIVCDIFISVLHTDSHPALSMLASCTIAGNCIFIDVTNVLSPKIVNCFHLHGGSLDRIKFSIYGSFLGIGNSQTGQMFIIGKRAEQQRMDVLGFMEIGECVRQFFV